MKRTLLAIVAAFLMMTSAYAQRLANVRAEATLITDKMVLELGLSNAQRNGILNINLNYLNGIRSYLAKDSIDEKSLFTLLINALNDGDYATASGLQVEMYDKVEELKSLYDSYVKNMI